MIKKTVLLLVLNVALACSPAQAKKNNSPKNCKLEKGIHFCQSTKKGFIRLKQSIDDIEAETISFNLKEQKMAGDLILHHAYVYDDHHYKDVIKGKFLLNNLSGQHARVQYQIILKDLKGHIAKTTGHIHLPMGMNHVIPCSNIPLHIKDIQNISSYEIKFTTSHLPVPL